MNNVSAVIVTYNIGDRFRETIKSLEDSVNEIVVVDNGSNYETIKMLKLLENKITLITLNENKGIAYALNKGIEYCLKKKYDWILTLDHDSIPYRNMIDEMLDCYDKFDEKYKSKVAMIVPNHFEERYLQDYKEEKGYEEVLTEITSGSLVKRYIYEKVGIYDERLFIDLVDHDYCLFLNKKGYVIVKVKSSILKHNLGESTKHSFWGLEFNATNHSPIRRYYMTRNRLYIWKKYKRNFKKWVLNDKKKFLSELFKIIMFEKDKSKKIKMIFRGIRDYLQSKDLGNNINI